MMGNYNHIYDIENPHAVAQYLKVILKNLAEPLCPFNKLDSFIGIAKSKDQYKSLISHLRA